MSTINEELETLLADEEKLVNNKLTRFAYTEKAYTDNDANGVETYNVTNEQNVPTSNPGVMKINQTVVDKGYRSQASSITRMFMNHFFGRTSFNLNKLTDYFARLITSLKEKLGTANGIATLDEDGRIPYSQLPESAIEVRGSWNAATNTWVGVDESTGSLINGTGTLGDFYLCDVEGWFNASTGESSATEPEVSEGYEQYFVNDRVLYNGSEWVRLKAGEVKTVNGVAPKNGNVTLTKEDIGLGNVANVATDSELNPDSDNNISNKAVTKAIDPLRKMNAIHDNHLLPTNVVDLRLATKTSMTLPKIRILDDETAFVYDMSQDPPTLFTTKNFFDWYTVENFSISSYTEIFKLEDLYFVAYTNVVHADSFIHFYASKNKVNWVHITDLELKDTDTEFYPEDREVIEPVYYKGSYYINIRNQRNSFGYVFKIDNLTSSIEDISIERGEINSVLPARYVCTARNMLFAYTELNMYYKEENEDEWTVTNLSTTSISTLNVRITDTNYTSPTAAKFVINCATNSSQGMAYSLDGKTWTNSNITNIEFTVASVNNIDMLCVNARNYQNAKGTYYSKDGKTWTQSSLTSGYATFPPLYKNGTWVNLIDSSSARRGIYYSIDGESWTEASSETGTLNNVGGPDIYYYNNVFYTKGTGSSYSCYYSVNGGRNWNTLPSIYTIFRDLNSSINKAVKILKHGELIICTASKVLCISDVNVLIEQGIL